LKSASNATSAVPPSPSIWSDDVIVTCGSCGTALDRLGDIKMAIDKAAIEAAVNKPFEDIFKGLDGITIKKE
jgi:hypothetical protein